MKELFFRVDGNNTIGYGHLFRCIALAEMLKSDFTISIIEKDSNDFAYAQYNKIAKTIIHINAQNLAEEVQEVTAYINATSIVILDGYQFTSDYQKAIKNTGAILICIDDLHAIHFHADVIINQSASVSLMDYSTEPNSLCCFGFEWIIQRPAFIKSSFKSRKITSVETVFFTLGGGPVFTIAPKILTVLEQITQIKRIVILKGNTEVFEKDIYPFIQNSKKNISVYEGLNDIELCELLQSCEIAICPASVISLEACSVGIGLFVGTTANNQNDNYKGLIQNELAFPLGDLYAITEVELKLLLEQKLNNQEITLQIDQQKRIFDGQNKSRYSNLFRSL